MGRQNPKTNGKCCFKTKQTKTQNEIHTHIHEEKEKKRENSKEERKPIFPK